MTMTNGGACLPHDIKQTTARESANKKSLEHSPALNLFVLYETPAHAQLADRLIQRLAATFQSDLDVQADAWDFDLLAYSHLRDLAAVSAGQADLIVVAASAHAVMPSHVMSWFKEGSSHQRVREKVALVALVEGKSRPCEEGLPDILRRLAAESRMDFFCQEDYRTPELTDLAELGR